MSKKNHENDEKVAIVTGASRGIGKAVADRLASMGYHVALLARTMDELELVSRDIQHRYGVKADCYKIDVTSKQQVFDCIAEIHEQYGHVDVVFNNAGIAFKGTSWIDPDKFEEMLKVNLLGAFYVIHAVAENMKQRQSGYIFNLVSRSGVIGRESLGGYAASKFGLRGFSEALYKELSPHHVKVTSLHPGWVSTDMTKGLDVPQEEMIQTCDIADIVECLLGLSRYTYVQDIVIEPQAVIKTIFPFQRQ
ncbi:MAG: SDR family NAD(P)-dependent oxidoreductase [Coxiellaceae bacterium]|nr:SDR family NAD(P)-dependent oxidoreductase [Coxiellaceae bacterium]